MKAEEKEKRIEITKTWIKKFENNIEVLDYEIKAIESILTTLKEDLEELEITEAEDGQ